MAKVNLIGTPVAAALDDYLDQLCKGNEGNADINTLELDGTVMHYDITMQHLHRIKNPFGGKITVYSLTTHARGKVDVLNPKPSDIKFCVDSPFGEVCATLSDIIKIAAGYVA